MILDVRAVLVFQLSTILTIMASVESDAMVNAEQDSEAYEAVHVHEVYNQIASHFSSTRYKV